MILSVNKIGLQLNSIISNPHYFQRLKPDEVELVGQLQIAQATEPVVLVVLMPVVFSGATPKRTTELFTWHIEHV